MAASSDNKAVARALATAFGGKPLVDTYWDNARATRIDLLPPVALDVAFVLPGGKVSWSGCC